MKEFEDQGTGAGIEKWHTCFDCGQKIKGTLREPQAVFLALCWANWKTCLGRPESDWFRLSAMVNLGAALSNAEDTIEKHEALSILEASLDLAQRYHQRSHATYHIEINLANCLDKLDRYEEALCIRRRIHSFDLNEKGPAHEESVKSGENIAHTLKHLHRFAEAKRKLRGLISVANETSGIQEMLRTSLDCSLACTLMEDPAATLDDLHESERLAQGAYETRRRVLGPTHRETRVCEVRLNAVRKMIEKDIRYPTLPQGYRPGKRG